MHKVNPQSEVDLGTQKAVPNLTRQMGVCGGGGRGKAQGGKWVKDDGKEREGIFEIHAGTKVATAPSFSQAKHSTEPSGAERSQAGPSRAEPSGLRSEFAPSSLSYPIGWKMNEYTERWFLSRSRSNKSLCDHPTPTLRPLRPLRLSQ